MTYRFATYKFACVALVLLPALLALAIAGCGRHSDVWERLQEAERVINEHPDSALAIIDSIDASALGSDAVRARHALLKSMALDKCWIDTTAFDVLQPAIDYYERHGSADDKLRTLYYQGRIYQNRLEYDSAMVCFMRGKEYSSLAADTLTVANLLVAQGVLLYTSNIYEDCIDLNLQAINMYRKIGREDYVVSSLNKALICTIALKLEQRSDSIVAAIEREVGGNEEMAAIVAPTMLSYIVEFGDKEDLQSVVEGYEPEDLGDDDTLIDFAIAYYKLDDAKNAMRFLDATSPQAKSKTSYKAARPYILELYGDLSGALEAFRVAAGAIDSINAAIFRNDLLFLQETFAIEKSKMQELRKMDRVVWGSLCIALVLLVATSIIYYRYRLSRSRSMLRLSENEKLLLEREIMHHKLAELESESASLKALADAQKELPAEVHSAIKERIDILNSLLASRLSENAKHEKSYKAWIKELTDNTEAFMNSNRLAFQASHPRFIQHLADYGLTVDEINYACLYALGLNGREVGAYMARPSHIHISSAIRKKLGLDMHQTNLAVYLRRALADD